MRPAGGPRGYPGSSRLPVERTARVTGGGFACNLWWGQDREKGAYREHHALRPATQRRKERSLCARKNLRGRTESALRCFCLRYQDTTPLLRPRGGPQVLEGHTASVRPAGARLATEEDPGIGVGLPFSSWASGRHPANRARSVSRRPCWGVHRRTSIGGGLATAETGHRR
jgi:hypothetical protein